MNAITNAMQKINVLIDATTASNLSIEDIKTELMKLTKAELVERLSATMKAQAVSIESIAKVILEDPDCAWLTYDQIATTICKRVPGAKTSSKSLATYASRYPKEKDWNVAPRKRASEINEEMMKLVNL